MLKFIKYFLPRTPQCPPGGPRSQLNLPELTDYLKKTYWLKMEQIEATGLARTHADRIISNALVDSTKWTKNLAPQSGEYSHPPSILIRERPTVILETEREAVLSILEPDAGQRLIPCKIGPPDARGLVPLTVFRSLSTTGAATEADEHTLWLKPGNVTLIGIDPDIGATTKARPAIIPDNLDQAFHLHFLRLKLLEDDPDNTAELW